METKKKSIEVEKKADETSLDFYFCAIDMKKNKIKLQ
jgi:hypothetical protein